MPNQFVFDGRLAATPELVQHGETKIAKIRLIRNEYAGKDDQGRAKQRTVAIPFTAFGTTAERIAENCMTGDQLIVTAQLSNNDFTDKDDVKRYDYTFEVRDFDFGAPGPEKRRKLQEGA